MATRVLRRVPFHIKRLRKTSFVSSNKQKARKIFARCTIEKAAVVAFAALQFPGASGKGQSVERAFSVSKRFGSSNLFTVGSRLSRFSPIPSSLSILLRVVSKNGWEPLMNKRNCCAKPFFCVSKRKGALRGLIPSRVIAAQRGLQPDLILKHKRSFMAMTINLLIDSSFVLNPFSLFCSTILLCIACVETKKPKKKEPSRPKQNDRECLIKDGTNVEGKRESSKAEEERRRRNKEKKHEMDFSWNWRNQWLTFVRSSRQSPKKKQRKRILLEKVLTWMF